MTILVVGAGVIGCAVAHELASRGARVQVVDARGIGLGATRASAGMLAPYIEGHLPALRTLGLASLALYDRFVQRVIEDSGQPVEYERSGTLQVAVTPAEMSALCADARTLAEIDAPHKLLDADGVRGMAPQLRANVEGGLHIVEHGYIAVGPLTHALAAAARARGAVFSTQPARAIDPTGAPRVITADGSLSADALIIAAGTWSSALTVATDVVKPIRGQLLQLRLQWRAAPQIVWGSRCYLVPWHDGTVLAGATVEDTGFDETATAAGVQELLAASAELMPALAGAAFEEVRVGLRPMTRDELPAIGPSSTMRHVFYATGHYRNGVLLAPLTAALVADLVLDGREGAELALMRPDRLGL